MADFTGYINGKNIIVSQGTADSTDLTAIAYATSHTLSFSAETKERAIKTSTTDTATALTKEKGVTAISATVTVEALRHSGDSWASLKTAFLAGTAVALKCEGPDGTTTSFNAVITSLEESGPAGDDSTYSATFENSGAIS